VKLLEVGYSGTWSWVAG